LQPRQSFLKALPKDGKGDGCVYVSWACVWL
jgi:hypothetical protein